MSVTTTLLTGKGQLVLMDKLKKEIVVQGGLGMENQIWLFKSEQFWGCENGALERRAVVCCCRCVQSAGDRKPVSGFVEFGRG